MLDSRFPPRQNDAVDGWEECPTVGHWNCRTDRLNGRVGRSGRVDKKVIGHYFGVGSTY
jgi:hypothetical protein